MISLLGGKNITKPNKQSPSPLILIKKKQKQFKLVGKISGSISYWNIFFQNMTYIFLFTYQTYIFNFIIPFHRQGY